jgi:hypothetical protein
VSLALAACVAIGAGARADRAADMAGKKVTFVPIV